MAAAGEIGKPVCKKWHSRTGLARVCGTALGLPSGRAGQRRGRQAGRGMARNRVSRPSGDGEEPPPEGFGGYQLLTQTDARCPAGQVVGEQLDGQPGGDHGVGIEAAVGPHRELSPGPGMAHSPHRLTQEVGRAASDSPGRRCSHGGVPPPWPVRSNIMPVSGLCRGD